jgi:hypothetical protein
LMSSVVTVVVLLPLLVILFVLSPSHSFSLPRVRVGEQSHFHMIENDNLLSSGLTRCDVYLSVDISKEYNKRSPV